MGFSPPFWGVPAVPVGQVRRRDLGDRERRRRPSARALLVRLWHRVAHRRPGGGSAAVSGLNRCGTRRGKTGPNTHRGASKSGGTGGTGLTALALQGNTGVKLGARAAMALPAPGVARGVVALTGAPRAPAAPDGPGGPDSPWKRKAGEVFFWEGGYFLGGSSRGAARALTFSPLGPAGPGGPMGPVRPCGGETDDAKPGASLARHPLPPRPRPTYACAVLPGGSLGTLLSNVSLRGETEAA